MNPIGTATAVNGLFVAGNPSAGQGATALSPEWCNDVQEEILNVIRAAGLTPGSDQTQLRDALLASLMPSTGWIPVPPQNGVSEATGTVWGRTAEGVLFASGGDLYWIWLVVPAGLTVDQLRVTHTRATSGSPSIEVSGGGLDSPEDLDLATNGAGGDVTETFTLAESVDASSAAQIVQLAITGAAGLVIKNVDYHYDRAGIASE